MSADGHVLRGRIANLSRGGVLATTRVTAPECLLGAATELELRLDGVDASWLELRGRIVRIATSSIAMQFDRVPPSFAEIIGQTLSRSRVHDRVLSVVLVDGTLSRRSQLADAFRAVGCVVVEVATPLEAIVRLGESHFEPDVIAIADSTPGMVSDELRRFVDVEHPHATLVAISSARGAPVVSHAPSAVEGGELAARIRDVLAWPPRP